MYRVFISHNDNPRDDPLVESFAYALRARGIDAYVAKHYRQPGHDVVQKVQQAIDGCNVVLVLLTKDGHASAAVNQEIGYSTKAGKLVVPFVERGVKPTLFVYPKEHIVFDPENPTNATRECIEYIANLKNKQESSNEALIGIGLLLLAWWAVSTASDDEEDDEE